MTETEKYKLSLYVTLEEIRSTSTSTVELVECTLDGKRYIKKTYHEDKRNVFEILRKIENEHIPNIQELFFAADTIVIEEYIEGKTLEQLISENLTFSSKEIKIIISGLTSALDTLHKNNVIHRDIKPANIILTEKGIPYLIDYSIARIYSQNNDADTDLLGTIGYAAPEQYGFSQTDFRSDIYSLGVTLKQITNKKNSSKRLIKTLKKASEFDPARRYQTVTKLSRRLKKENTMRKLRIGICSFILCGIISVSLHFHFAHGLNENLMHESIIVDSFEEIPCLSMMEQGTYTTKVSLGRGVPYTKISATTYKNYCELTINEEYSFTFYSDPSVFSDASWFDESNYTIVFEIIFHDMNDDGIREIIPVLANCDMPYYGYHSDPYVLYDVYNLAWCIYYDKDLGYQQAEGRLDGYNTTTFGTFTIPYQSSGIYSLNESYGDNYRTESYCTLEGNKLKFETY